MGIKLYKSGQGYWTRMLSAIGAAVLVLAGVHWLVTDQLATRQFHWPTTVTINVPAATKATVKSNPFRTWGFNQRELSDPGEDEKGVNAVITSRSPLRQAGLESNDKITMVGQTPIESVQDLGKALASVAPGKAWSLTVIRHYDYGLYAQIAIAVLLIALISFILYKVFNRSRIVDFMIATEAEMKKVNWPTKKEVIGSTWVVICGTLMLAFLMFAVDFIFAKLFIYIKVIDVGSAAAGAGT